MVNLIQGQTVSQIDFLVIQRVNKAWIHIVNEIQRAQTAF